MKLIEMKQDDLLQWIQSIPEDASFTSTIKTKIRDGIIAYSKAEDSEIIGEDFYDADAEDIEQICNIPKRNARLLLGKISDKKTEDFNKKKKETGSSKIVTFDLLITFTVISAMRGKIYKIKNVTKLTKVADVKYRFLAELGDHSQGGMISKWNKPGDKIKMKQGGRNMEDSKTLGDYDIVNGNHLPLVVSFKVIGGGGVPGPNLNNELKENDFVDDAPAYRVVVKGLNIEFKHNGLKVIGNIGYTTNRNKFPKGVFEAHRGKHIKMAYCPNQNTYCPNHDAIVRYMFCDCKVVFEDELTNGKEVYETKTYPNKCCYYEGDPARYANLEMTVTPR